MHAGLARDLLTLALGVLTGVVSAAFGVGGAALSTPGIRLLGVSALAAIGTTLPSILPSALTGTIRYGREGYVNWRVVRAVTPAGVLAAVVGSRLSRSVPGHGHGLMILTAVLLGVTALRMGRRPAAQPTRPDTLDVREAQAIAGPADAMGPLHAVADPAASDAGSRAGPNIRRRNRSPVAAVVVGITAGAMSGLLGLGGGIVMVPAFTEWLGMDLKPAIATSLACVGLFAIPSTIVHAFQKGDIQWRFALLLAIAVVPGARVGAAAALRAGDRRLRLVVAAFLGLVAIVYAAGEISALAG